MPAFAELETPHAQVHNGTREVFDLLENNLTEEDAAALESALHKMEEGSDGVFRILDKMLQQKLS